MDSSTALIVAFGLRHKTLPRLLASLGRCGIARTAAPTRLNFQRGFSRVKDRQVGTNLSAIVPRLVRRLRFCRGNEPLQPREFMQDSRKRWGSQVLSRSEERQI